MVSNVRVYSVSTVRNEADIIRPHVLYHLSAGIDRMLVVDNGSDDGTEGILQELSHEDPRLVWIRDPGPYRQAELLTELAREAERRGADWVVPLDADEFCYCPVGDLKTVLDRTVDGGLHAPGRQFIQRRCQDKHADTSLRHMEYAAPEASRNPEKGLEELIESGEIAYMEMQRPRKWIFRPTATTEVGKGSHTVDYIRGPKARTEEIVYLHAPLRSRSALEAKAEVGIRSEAAGRKPGQSWHLLRWERLRREGKLDEEWAANSQEEGELYVYGARRPALPDTTLRDALEPFLPPERSDESQSEAARSWGVFARDRRCGRQGPE